MTTTRPASVLAGLSDQDLLRDLAFVGGKWVAADDGSTFEVIDPASGEVIALNTGLISTEVAPDWGLPAPSVSGITSSAHNFPHRMVGRRSIRPVG